MGRVRYVAIGRSGSDVHTMANAVDEDGEYNWGSKLRINAWAGAIAQAGVGTAAGRKANAITYVFPSWMGDERGLRTTKSDRNGTGDVPSEGMKLVGRIQLVSMRTIWGGWAGRGGGGVAGSVIAGAAVDHDVHVDWPVLEEERVSTESCKF